MIVVKDMQEMNGAENNFYTVREAAQLLRVSEATVWRWAESARLPAYRVGRRIRIPRENLQAMVQPMGGKRDDFEQRRGIWAGYEPQGAQQAVEAGFGALADLVDAQQLKADLRVARDQNSSGRRW